MSAEFGRQPGWKTTEDLGWELRSATGSSVHDDRQHDQFLAHHETVSTWRVTFRLHPRTLDCKGRSSRWDKCATEAISSRSAVLVERSSMSSLAVRIEFERAGGVHRRIAGRSARMQTGPGEVKVLMGFEQDAAGDAEAQPARPGIVPVLPWEAEVEQHELTHLPFRNWCRHCVRAKGKESPHHESSPLRRVEVRHRLHVHG